MKNVEWPEQKASLAGIPPLHTHADRCLGRHSVVLCEFTVNDMISNGLTFLLGNKYFYFEFRKVLVSIRYGYEGLSIFLVKPIFIFICIFICVFSCSRSSKKRRFYQTTPGTKKSLLCNPIYIYTHL